MRISEDPAPELIRTAYARELADTPILYEGMSLADLAHVVMLTEEQVIPREAGGQLMHVLLSLHPRPPFDFFPDPATGDLYSNRVAYIGMLTHHVGYLSAGRARREAITIAYRIAARSRLLKLAAALIDLAHAAVDLAETHRATLFPDYTYLQNAQPTTFGHYMLGFAYPVLRDLDRLQAAFARTNASPAGSGSVNGSRLPLNRERLAELLGFDTLIQHTRDAMWQADGPIEIAALMSAALVNLDRLAEDLQVFATQEFGLVEIADRHSRLSVIMPQKKNPYSLTYVRGLTGEALGTLAAMAAIGKSLSGQPDTRIFAHGSVPRSLDQVMGAALLMAGVLRGLTVNVERAAQRAAAGFSGSTDLAEVLMQESDSGLDYGTAHKIVGRAVRDALESGGETPALNPEIIAGAAEAVTGHRIEMSAERLAGVLDPVTIVASRTGPGGAAEPPVTAMLAEIRAALKIHKEWQQECETRMAAAQIGLHTLAASFATKPMPEPTDPSTDSEAKGGGPKTMGDVLSGLPKPNWRRRRW
ncbi:MAG: argininosuccinate lyase [Anaerolineales bacterium]|nr:MAG: argininosuccinate lyase [Anaerolineales bacterium]